MASTSKLIQIVLRFRSEDAGLKDATNSLNALGNKLNSIGNAMTVGLSAPIVAIGALAAKTAIDFESAFAGVAKTVDGTEAELAQLRQELENLAISAESPVSSLKNAHMELFAIAEAAGQLGVAREDIVAFTDVMGQLAMTTDIAGEEGAALIARFANVAKMPLSEIRQFGDAIATLGNNSAATEQDILNMSLRLAAISELGFETDEILAYSTALSSLGINAELGGTNFMKGMNEIAKAVAMGGAELDEFARVAGMSSAEFSKAWKEDASGALQQFLDGLGAMNADQRIIELEKLGLTGSEMQRVFLSLAGSTEMLADTLNQSSAAFAGNGALMDEAAKRAETTAGRIERAKNMFNQVMNDFGEQLLPLIVDFLEKGVIPLLTWLNNLTDSQRQWIIGILATVAAIGPLLSMLGTLISLFSMLAGAMPVVAGAFTAFLALGAPVIALIAAIIAAGVLLIANWNEIGTTLSQLGALVAQGWQGIFKSIGTTLNQLGQLIWIGLSKLGEAAKGIGVAIVQGIWKGMVDGFKKMIAWILAKINEITQGIRNALGIKSPSAVMAKIGEQVVAGFNEGIASMGGVGVNVPSVGGAMQSRQPSLGLAGGGAGVAGGNVFQNTFVLPEGTTRQQAAEIMRFMGRESERRGARKIR